MAGDYFGSKKARTPARIHPFPLQPVPDINDLLKRGLCCAVLVLDPQGRIVLANAGMADILGESPEDLHGQTLDPAGPQSVLFRLAEPYARARAGLAPVDFSEIPLVRPDGRHVLVSGRITPLVSEGALKGVVVSCQDATSVAEMREQVGRLSSVVDESPFALLRVASDGRIVYANTAARSLLESQGLEVGRRLSEPHLGRVREVVATGRSRETLFTGNTCFLGICVALGDSGYAHIHAHDISECKQAQEDLVEVRDLLEHQMELVCRFDPNGRITYVNESYCTYFDKRCEDLIGTYFKPTIVEADRKRCELHFDSLTPENPVRMLEHRIVLDNGEERWQQWADRAIYDDAGELLGYQSVGRDITERIKAEQTFKGVCQENLTLRRKMEAVFQSISDAIVTVDKDLRVIRTNEALDGICSRATGMRPGSRLAEAFAQGESPPCMDLLSQVIQTRKPVRGVRAECACGTRPIQVTLLNASPLLDENNTFTGAVLVVRDITRLDELEKRFEERNQYRNIIGACSCMQDIYDTLERLSDIKTTVLVTGESGTGKELIVEALHYSSSLITGPLVKVNCAALAESLLESELFGHVRGAFTGAIRDRIGRFQAAEGGTIFLDEIGDLPPSIQVKLLRVLERKEYERVGDSTTLKADVRVVAATNADLPEKVEKGQFRKDLYYRLKVMVVDVPPLRERARDIPLLVNYFLDHYSRAFAKRMDGVTVEVMDVFMRYPWPGNIRELKHTIEHAAVLCRDGTISLRLLPTELRRFADASRETRDASSSAGADDAETLRKTLEQVHWNKAEAARLLGISRTTLYRKLHESGLQP